MTANDDKLCKLVMGQAKTLCLRGASYDCGASISRMRRTCFVDSLKPNWCEYAVEQSEFLCAPQSGGNGFDCGQAIGAANRYCR